MPINDVSNDFVEVFYGTPRNLILPTLVVGTILDSLCKISCLRKKKAEIALLFLKLLYLDKLDDVAFDGRKHGVAFVGAREAHAYYSTFFIGTFTFSIEQLVPLEGRISN